MNFALLNFHLHTNCIAKRMFQFDVLVLFCKVRNVRLVRSRESSTERHHTRIIRYDGRPAVKHVAAGRRLFYPLKISMLRRIPSTKPRTGWGTVVSAFHNYESSLLKVRLHNECLRLHLYFMVLLNLSPSSAGLLWTDSASALVHLTRNRSLHTSTRLHLSQLINKYMTSAK